MQDWIKPVAENPTIGKSTLSLLLWCDTQCNIASNKVWSIIAQGSEDELEFYDEIHTAVVCELS